ncbi:tetratricopeptide repeat protein [Ornithinibacillus halophilus]|uniref:TolA-binding protein n=1 Tax=Ornithinibacillus halophilus TaxID=930117 RepID=A0A1M5HJP0_9BACI|nr:tetratricopeptide repeat protein [Ornithinibacillus halophilus]SHG16147.1 TolA-binding protein [Ornithinibacillus halophilus]
MNEYQQIYQKTLQFIEQEDYESAKSSLRNILSRYPNHQEGNWMMGLLEAATGNPFVALERWNGLSEEKVPQVIQKRASVREKLETYQQFYRSYNEAIDFIQQEDFSKAKDRLEKVVGRQSEDFPLPVSFYQAYLLVLLYLDEHEMFDEIIANLPVYVSRSKEVKPLLKRRSESVQQVVSIKKNRFGGVKLAAGLVLAVAVGAFGGQFIGEDSQPSVSQVDSNNDEVAEETNDNDPDVATSAYLEEVEQKLAEATAVNDSQSEDLDRLQQEKEELEQSLTFHEKLFEVANIPLDHVINQASIQSYNDGRLAFVNGNYQAAASYFEDSYFLNQENYVADDSLYYLIVSNQMLGDMRNNEELFASFLENYPNSPYYDDVLLKQAEFLVDQGEVQQALPILDELLQSFDGEWTAKRASSMKQALMEEQS